MKRFGAFRYRTICFLIIGCMLVSYTGCCFLCKPKTCIPSLNLVLQDSQGRSLDRIEVGRTLNAGLRGLEPNRSYTVELVDDDLQLVSFYRLTTDRNGVIEPAPVWFHSGVIGCDSLIEEHRRSHQFRTFDEAYEALRHRTFYLRVRDREGGVMARYPLPVMSESPGNRPLFFFSDADGCLRNRFVEKKDFVYLTGKNLPPGARVQIFLVPNKYGWKAGMRLQDIRKQYQKKPHIIQLKKNQTSFTEILWQSDVIRAGAYDAVTRVNDDMETSMLLSNDFVTYITDTGTVIQFLTFDPPWTPGDFDIAGRPDRNWGYPYFEFHDVFEVGEEMWGAVDPAMVPASHPGGDFAAIYVIQHNSGPTLTDETTALEIVPVKRGCVNASMTRIWNNPTLGEYDIVVDFGSTSATTSSQWTGDGIFNPGTDFIDRATNIGAFVLNDPSASPGPFPTSSYTYEPASSSTTDPLRTDVSSYFNSPDSGVSETMDNVPLRGVGYYPDGTGPFPLVLIAHGNHNPLHASHTGYDYLCRLLAEYGIIAISIDENFLNGSVSGEMDARAIVILRHLQKWREWNNTTGNTFHNKVDLNKIGLCGHSRGGEAIAVANLFNSTLHNTSDQAHNFDFNIKALYAIAPVDGQIESSYSGVPILINNANYFIMHGSHDGDVFTMGGQKMYDRAFPTTSSTGDFKGLLFIHGANHNYWNEEWVYSNDASLITSPLSQISDTHQQNIAKVYVSAFFQFSFFDDDPVKALKALFTGDVTFDSIPPGITMVHQYCDTGRIDLNNYEEDHNSATGTYTGVTNAYSGLSSLLDQDIIGTWSWSTCSLNNSYYTWNQTSGVIAGWNSAGAIYEINLPSAIGSLVDIYPYLSLRIGQIYEDPSSMNPAGADKDLSIELELTATPNPINTHKLKVSNFDDLPYPINTIWTHPYCGGNANVSKSVMKTVRIPLRSFVVNKSDWNLSDIQKIKIKFDQSTTGLVVVDDIQLTK